MAATLKRSRRRRPPTPFRPGTAVEFRSSDRGGCWKPGVVDRVMRENNQKTPAVRILVGPGVLIVRKAANCRVSQGG